MFLNMKKKNSKKKTICYITAQIFRGLGMQLYSGITDAARDLDFNIVCITGDSINNPERFKSSANFIYKLIDKTFFDGLISWTSTIGSIFMPKDEVQKFYYENFKDIPLVSIGIKIKNQPFIVMDDYKAIKDIMEHLIEHHGYTKIGFVRGPDDKHYSSQKRYLTYLELLKKYNIPVNKNLIIPPKKFESSSGTETANIFFKLRKLKPKKDIEAIITLSDMIAIPLLEEVKKMGINVPEEIAITGFNNQITSKAISPQLTTIDSKYYITGYKSVEILSDLFNNKKITEDIFIQTDLIIRQSCGCKESSFLNVLDSDLHQKTKIDIKEINKKEIIKYLKKKLYNMDKYINEDLTKNLLNFFLFDIDKKSYKFINFLNGILEKLKSTDFDIFNWQNIISELRKLLLPYLKNIDQIKNAEYIFHQARVLINHAENFSLSRSKDELTKLAISLNNIATNFSNTYEISEIFHLLEKSLKELEINDCYLAIYANPSSHKNKSNLVFAYENNERLKIDEKGIIFKSIEILPKKILIRKKRLNVVMKSIYFRNNQIGYIIFDSNSFNVNIFEAFTTQISAAIQGTIIINDRKKIEDDLRKSEERFRNMVETSSDWIWQIDKNLKYTYSSLRVFNILGYLPIEVIDKILFDFISDEDKNNATNYYTKIITDKSLYIDMENIYINKKNEKIIIKTTGVPIFDSGRNIIGYQGINSDITEQKKIQEEKEALLKNLANKNLELEQKVDERTADLIQLNKQLQIAIEEANKANAAKSKFLANMSHEIRTPLNCIIGFTELIHSAKSDLQKEQYIKLILNESDKLMQLLNQLLDISKIEAGKMVINKLPFDFYKLIEAIKSVFSVVANNKGLSFKCNVDKNIPESLLGDNLRLHQILNNLINNAIKFTSKGSIEIDINLLEKIDDKAKIKFNIKDTGIGISKNNINNIFDVFYQATDKYSFKYHGTGLGTAIAKELVNLMGGEIGVSSEEEVGSIFWFEITFKISNVKISDKKIELNKINYEELIKQINKNDTILLVEDYKPNRDVLKIHLEELGFKILEADNGKMALDLFNKHNIKLILMDVQMPEMNGYESTENIRKLPNGSNVIIIGTTANAFEQDIKKCIEIGMNDVLAKPYRKEQLVEMLIKWFDLKIEKPISNNEVKNNENAKINNELINFNKLLTEFNNNKKFIYELVDDLIINGKEQIIIIGKAISDNNFETIWREAHKIKGCAANLTAKDLASTALSLELSGKNNDIDQCKINFDNLITEFNAIEDFIANIKKGDIN